MLFLEKNNYKSATCPKLIIKVPLAQNRIFDTYLKHRVYFTQLLLRLSPLDGCERVN